MEQSRAVNAFFQGRAVEEFHRVEILSCLKAHRELVDGGEFLCRSAAAALALRTKPSRASALRSAMSILMILKRLCAGGTSRRSSRLFFVAEFLESGIAAQWVPKRIEPKKSRSNGR